MSMRDSRSFTGVQCTQNVFAVAGDGSYVLFKKSASELFYFVPNNLDEQKVLKLMFLDQYYIGDSIFDLVFHENQLVILIQSQVDDSIRLALCTVTKDFVIATKVLPGSIKKGLFNKLINDEFGPVFITYSVSFHETDPSKRQVQLVHIVESLRNQRLQLLNIQVPRQTKKAGEVWCDPFISRNRVYFFNQYDYTMMTLLATSGKCEVSKVKLRSANPQYPNLPSLSFVHRHSVVFADHVFVYFSQMLPPPDPRTPGNVQHAWKLHIK
uniref:CNH domain-containing protein n=1 Tax=Panagrellus redivivus TaxID=6233 RepID=A0A7E4ZUL0_PANRE